MNIFVGNLSFSSTEDDVKNLFKDFGNVASVVIVMSKEKKAPKSRGFGFVEMPDDQEALSAIAALNGKEFMGRVLNVGPSRPKTEAEKESELQEKKQAKARAKAEAKAKSYIREDAEQKKAWTMPVYRKPGTFKGGRRSQNYMKRQASAGVQEESKPRGRPQDNPMRWRKNKYPPKPWQKGPGEDKPWKKTEEGAKPWSKSSGDSKPWHKPEGRSKPWEKPEGRTKPWEKSEGRSKPWEKPEGEPKPWKKREGGFKPYDKAQGESKPWKKTTGEAKPWSKTSERPQGSRFKARRKPGGYKR